MALFSHQPAPGARLFWLSTSWACGGVWVVDGVIRGGAPIFRKLAGNRLGRLPPNYKYRPVRPMVIGHVDPLPPMVPRCPGCHRPSSWGRVKRRGRLHLVPVLCTTCEYEDTVMENWGDDAFRTGPVPRT